MLTNPAEFRESFKLIRSAVNISSRLPGQVFQPGYGSYQFLEFDRFINGEFWAMLRQLMMYSQAPEVLLMVLDPDAESYFYRNFGRFGALRIPERFSTQQYVEALNTGPESSPADALAINSWVLVWAPPSVRWVIWGERESEILVLAYESGFNGPSAIALAESGMCVLTPEDALDVSSGAWRDRGAFRLFAQELLKHYSLGQPWTDPAVARVLEIARELVAGKMGTIEASRTLSSFRHQVEPDLMSLFQDFVAIDSETDALPIGSVRAEWTRESLAIKDAEIASCEQFYHPLALKACVELIERLQPTPDSAREPSAEGQ